MVNRLPHQVEFAQRGATRRWLICLASGWMLALLTSSYAQAGCHHPTADSSDQQRIVEPALLGKWLYVGGEAHLVSHPAPPPCDGPSCRRSTDPLSELSVIPSPEERTTSVASVPNGALFVLTQRGSGRWLLEDQRLTSIALTGLLRPPC